MHDDLAAVLVSFLLCVIKGSREGACVYGVFMPARLVGGAMVAMERC